MYPMFGDHKLTLDISDKSSLMVKKVEITWDEQADIDQVMNEVFRPILIALSYTNDTISEAFNMNECGERLEEEEKIELDIRDDIIGSDVSGTESVNLKECDYDTNEV